MMDSKEIRQSFIDYFRERDHQRVRSAPVVPLDDPTLLFTNAGMNQFKPIFLNEQEAQFARAVNSQKCIRVSGKHNDLEEVGVDTFHHTFFEMLGNWSFGDYYKAEAIEWAWKLFTDVWGLDKNRLWATVYKDDDEAFDLWEKVTDIPKDRILRFGAKDNFWEMGDTGPCGPCSEIHYYIGDDVSKMDASGVNADDQYWELWNLVFIQYNRDEAGKLHDLPAKHVDTGAGLERIVAVMQGKISDYDTDLFQPIIREIDQLTGASYHEKSVPQRVIADHIRMLSTSIADGAMPSNEGRGYVLRRILRRASRFGRILGQHEPFIYQLVSTVGDILGDEYPEIVDKRVHIENVIKAEEKSFNETLDRGLIHFDRILDKLAGNTIPGEEAFRLYDTYGFPLDLTQLMAREKGLTVDETGFDKSMAEQRKRAKTAGNFKRTDQKIEWQTVSSGMDSQFMGYQTLETESHLRRWGRQNGHLLLVLDKTPFYAEAGGQIGDTGSITGSGIDLKVQDTQKDGETIVHYCDGDFGETSVSGTLRCQVDAHRRQAIRLNHTATHLLHKTLKIVLGDHVHQAGSLVAPDYLRFDVTHFEKITPDQLDEVERIVNKEILQNTELQTSIRSFDEAREEGAEALFGEKYGNEVRVITVGDYSKELCGGTHVDRTGDIGAFKITEESSLAAGVRRIIAVTGEKAVELMQNQAHLLTELQTVLKCGPDELPDRIQQLIRQRKDLEKALTKGQKGPRINVQSLVAEGKTWNDHTIVSRIVDALSIDELKRLGDELRNGLSSGVGVLGFIAGDKPSLVIVVTQDLIKHGIKAGDLAKLLGSELGGGGGGKPHLATAGGKDPEKLDEVIHQSTDRVIEYLEKNRGNES